MFIFTPSRVDIIVDSSGKITYNPTADQWWEEIKEKEMPAPKFNHETLKDIFTYHAPTERQAIAYEAIRNAAFEFSLVLVGHTPESPDQSAAIRLLRECVMTANAAVALEGKY